LNSPEDADLRKSTGFARPFPRTIAIANQKGGVGKTTTAVNLSASLADLGYRVLVVDLDPQGNATTALGVNARSLKYSIYDVLMQDAPMEDAVEATSIRPRLIWPGQRSSSFRPSAES
jgi:chromosome partitioning protein